MRPTSVTTGEVRLSYPHLFSPHKSEMEDVASYSAEIMVPKSDTKTMADIEKAMNAAIQEYSDKVWGGQVPPKFKNPLIKDGDASENPQHHGYWLFTAKNKLKEGAVIQPPKVMDQQLNPIIDQSEIYGGVWARVNINFYLYNFKGTKGIGCGFDAGVVKVRDDEPFGGGRTSVEDAFGAPQSAPAQAINPLTGMPY